MSWQHLKNNLHSIAESLHIAKQKRDLPAQPKTGPGGWLGWDGWVNLPAGDDAEGSKK